MLQDLPPDFELYKLRRSLEYVNDFRIAIDGGAHRGIWTKYLLERFAVVFSFELEESNFCHLEKINSNSFHAALGDRIGIVGSEPGPENTGQYHVTESGDTELICLDEFELENVDFLKLDVEGYELFALRGATETILRCRPIVLIEENGLSERYGVELGEACRYIESLGYELIRKMNKDYLYKASA